MNSTQALSSSGGEGPGDTALSMETPDSYVSEGPTLPIIGGASEHTDWNLPVTRDQQSNGIRPAKKRKTNSGVGVDTTTIRQTHMGASDLDLTPLHRPWTLLPPALSEELQKKLGHDNCWEDTSVSIVFTKNQNVKSGINRLKTLLGPGINGDAIHKDKSKRKDNLIAVSAYGEGTTKLVGIVEMTRRIIGTTKEQGGESVRWYVYTVLTGLAMQQQQKNDMDGSLETEAGGSEITEDHEMRKIDVKLSKTPVLTTWFSRESIPEFKSAFGEQTFDVHRTSID